MFLKMIILAKFKDMDQFGVNSMLIECTLKVLNCFFRDGTAFCWTLWEWVSPHPSL